ncbi:BREX-2 system adenine-specific DNA-methyltransferase PglX [Corallococcus exercitus]|uniref:BREX-2 system adenine-specific DNA-methyltransferase PglX n=1 Tax=Corallococcus exercitus TaxID=2316736 RepID=UPI0035D4474E
MIPSSSPFPWLNAPYCKGIHGALRGGGASQLKEKIEDGCLKKIRDLCELIGFGAVTREDEVFELRHGADKRSGISPEQIAVLGNGELIRDWGMQNSQLILFPYSHEGTCAVGALGRHFDVMWRYRAQLWLREGKGFKTKKESGGRFYEYSMFYPERYFASLKIAFAEIATHNHFFLDRGGTVFTQTAPLIKLRVGVSEAECLALLGQLNSSTAEFWMKQVYQPKGGDKMGNGGRVTGEGWEERYQRDGTKLKSFPVRVERQAQVEAFAGSLDVLARVRNEDSAWRCIERHAGSGASILRAALHDRRESDLARLCRMVGLQEELDWLCYGLYGVESDSEVRRPEDVLPLIPGQRPFEITLAREDSERRAALAHGEEADEAPTVWFERHGWEPVTSLDTIPDATERRIIEQRLALAATNRNLALIEQPTYKRRWYRPDYATEEKQAFETYLSECMEEWAKGRASPFTLRQIVAALQADAGVLAVAECLAGNAQFDLEALLSGRLLADSVPNNKNHVFKPSGLDKRAAWEATWELQRREDAGEKVTPPVPPKYASADYLRPEYWSLRGALDVPKERFIAFTELPWRDGAERLYGWAGWTTRQRSKVLIELDEESEGSGVALADRYGLLYGAQFLVPYVAWESKEAAAEFDAVVRGLVGKDGVTEKMLSEWAERFPATRPRATRARRRTA